MKMIGILASRLESSRCRSGPVMPGMVTSRIKHSVRPIGEESRNASADENDSAPKPSSLSKSGSDSRTDSSSSTTVTSERALLMTVVDDDESVRESLPDLLRELGFGAESYSSAE